ncbi:DUF4982 domain-containing protein [Halosquirtibacter xylanolyticus]|uniref:DUF4982 domain-containing protein n=1 Tax=Halosquirtibacter xylanolyticus TaxID=3374599 RepID=UPI003747DA90|nr:DUF4982 domain-containing protein [Prolixibacteraceae bacterium]
MRESNPWFEHQRKSWGWRASLSSWTWNIEKTTPMTVEIFSGCEKVELLLNGKSLGKKNTNDSTKLRAYWTVPYEKGEITIEARAIDITTNPSNIAN